MYKKKPKACPAGDAAEWIDFAPPSHIVSPPRRRFVRFRRLQFTTLVDFFSNASWPDRRPGGNRNIAATRPPFPCPRGPYGYTFCRRRISSDPTCAAPSVRATWECFRIWIRHARISLLARCSKRSTIDGPRGKRWKLIPTGIAWGWNREKINNNVINCSVLNMYIFLRRVVTTYICWLDVRSTQFGDGVTLIRRAQTLKFNTCTGVKLPGS